MLSDDSVAERFCPDVREIVLALDAADPQLVRFDFIQQPQMRHVDVFHFTGSMSMENVICCFCVNDQSCLQSKPQVTPYALDPLRFWRLQC